jgi:hypothetical protein
MSCPGPGNTPYCLYCFQPAAPVPRSDGPFDASPGNPLRSFDARDWARELLRLHSGKTIGKAPDGNCCYFNEGDATGWFANALMRGFDEHRWQQEKQPAAPEPSAVQYGTLVHAGFSCADTELGHSTWMCRAVSAESQLAAVRNVFGTLPAPEQLRTDKRLTMDQKHALADLIELLSPPSPSAVPGEKP